MVALPKGPEFPSQFSGYGADERGGEMQQDSQVRWLQWTTRIAGSIGGVTMQRDSEQSWTEGDGEEEDEEVQRASRLTGVAVKESLRYLRYGCGSVSSIRPSAGLRLPHGPRYRVIRAIQVIYRHVCTERSVRYVHTVRPYVGSRGLMMPGAAQSVG